MSLEPARKSVVFSRTWGMGARELKLIGKLRGFFGSRGTIGRQSISSLNSESLLLHIVNWSRPETARTGVKDQFLPLQGLGGWRFFAKKGNYRRGCRQGCIRRRKSREAQSQPWAHHHQPCKKMVKASVVDCGGHPSIWSLFSKWVYFPGLLTCFRVKQWEGSSVLSGERLPSTQPGSGYGRMDVGKGHQAHSSSINTFY